MRSLIECAVASGLLLITAGGALAGETPVEQASQIRGCNELFKLPGLIWRGRTATMTLQDLASYAAPVFWLSPDEPTLHRQRGRDMRVPAAFPFESQPDSPVIYYQVMRAVEGGKGTKAGVEIDAGDKARSVIDFDVISGVFIKYIAYFPEEAGVGDHKHDVEPTEVRLVIGRANGDLARRLGFRCDLPDYVAVVTRVTGEAHGNPWYYNVLEVDSGTELPIHILVEEGKHATATDKNADGYYTPGYDVTVRPNDAWGVRDTIRGGTLFSGKFEAWMAKVRRPEHRVLPPLPADSPLVDHLVALGADPAINAVYALRPYPASSLAAGDALLQHKIKEKETAGWPVVEKTSLEFTPIGEALNEGRELKPFSVAFRSDSQPGLAIAFPLLLVKNIREPLTGGYIVNRMYFKDEKFRDWGWMAMYTPSASRWLDQYLAAGIDTDASTSNDGTDRKNRDFVLEAGLKLRFRAPNRVFGAIIDFWGFRAGIKSLGAPDIDHLSYVFEFGAGVW